MVVRQTLGIVDLLGAVAFAAIALGHPFPHLQAAAGLGLMLKGAMFISDIASIFDILIGIVLFLLFWFSWTGLALGLAVYLGLKGVLSLV